jgi:hypothetical protein
MATIEHVEAHVGVQAEDVDCRHAREGRMLIQRAFCCSGSATGVTVGPAGSLPLAAGCVGGSQRTTSPEQVIHPLPAAHG